MANLEKVEKPKAYLVTVVEPFEGLGLQQDPLECTSTYTVLLTAKQHDNLIDHLDELKIEDASQYEYEYEDHYGIEAYRVESMRRAKVANQLRSLRKFLAWRTPKPDGPKGMLLNKGKEDEED